MNKTIATLILSIVSVTCSIFILIVLQTIKPSIEELAISQKAIGKAIEASKNDDLLLDIQTGTTTLRVPLATVLGQIVQRMDANDKAIYDVCATTTR